MATGPKTAASSGTPDMSDIGTQVTNNLAAADNIAAERAQALTWIHQARAAQLSRSAAALKAQYGADDAGVKSSEAAAAAASATAARVAVVHQQVATADPQVAKNGWALHGRVYEVVANKPTAVSGFTVFLADTSGAYQQSYGFAFTDDTGYFLLNYPGSEPASRHTSTAAAQSADAPELFIKVADREAKREYRIDASFQPVIGSATYQNIYLPTGQQSAGQPPPEIRQVALPKTKKSR
jgi:hypothetical protein